MATYSRTTEKPAASATFWTALPTSWSRLPFTSWSMPANIERSVTSMRRRASSETSPTGAVYAASPWYPSTIAPQSTEMMSPSTSV